MVRKKQSWGGEEGRGAGEAIALRRGALEEARSEVAGADPGAGDLQDFACLQLF
jgi:hypothetical protein